MTKGQQFAKDTAAVLAILDQLDELRTLIVKTAGRNEGHWVLAHFQVLRPLRELGLVKWSKIPGEDNRGNMLTALGVKVARALNS